MSSRIIRSRLSRRGRTGSRPIARASSVLPTPVGPQNSSTPIGRLGSFIPALNVVTTSAAASHASSWPITRARRWAATASASSGSSSRTNSSGSPVSFTNRSTQRGLTEGVTDWPADAPCFPARGTVVQSDTTNPDAAPGNAWYGRNRACSRWTCSTVPPATSSLRFRACVVGHLRQRRDRLRAGHRRHAGRSGTARRTRAAAGGRRPARPASPRRPAGPPAARCTARGTRRPSPAGPTPPVVTRSSRFSTHSQPSISASSSTSASTRCSHWPRYFMPAISRPPLVSQNRRRTRAAAVAARRRGRGWSPPARSAGRPRSAATSCRCRPRRRAAR